MNNSRLTISPTPAIEELLTRAWPARVPRHRLMRVALKLGLATLAKQSAEQFRESIVADLSDALEE